ncbi:MAG: nucleotidyltransferase family protein [Ruminococcaceae bacterium]|nr:nucleotidyltransferase family protein [Oscillospiraceae bacterium]
MQGLNVIFNIKNTNWEGKHAAMKITAVICEYNPFHKGHLSQIEYIKKQDSLVVCIMSGGFVQRGEPSIYNKYKRAKASVLSGADLVLELPYPYSCSAAEHFCKAGVSIASSLNCVDELCFGSESGDIEFLSSVSDRLTSAEFLSALKEARKDKSNKEKPFASLRDEVYFDLYGEKMPIKPNDILGIEYINSIKTLNSNIVPVTYKREKGFSATKSRGLIKDENDFSMIPDVCSDIFKDSDIYKLKNIESAILHFYRTVDIAELEKCESMTNGMARKLIECSKKTTSFDEFIESLSAKTYTNARIRRAILHGMTGVLPDMLKERPLFTQVLACNERGRKIIRQAQRNGDIEILTKPSHYKKLSCDAKKQAEFCIKSDSLLTLTCDNPKSYDFFLKQTPFVLNSDITKLNQ